MGRQLLPQLLEEAQLFGRSHKESVREGGGLESIKSCTYRHKLTQNETFVAIFATNPLSARKLVAKRAKIRVDKLGQKVRNLGLTAVRASWFY